MPVDPATLAAFSLTALAIVISPGPDTLLIVRYGLISGHRAALAAVAGVQAGLVAHTALAIAGISVVIASSPVLFRAVALAGAVYLAWLGVRSLSGSGAFDVSGAVDRSTPRSAFRDAFVCNLLNPKVIVLFLALFPNFVAVDRGDVPKQLITLAVTLVVINVAWQAPLAWLAKSARRYLERKSVQRLVSATTGCILLLFAFLLVYDHVTNGTT